MLLVPKQLCLFFQFCIILANSADPNEMPRDVAFQFWSLLFAKVLV